MAGHMDLTYIFKHILKSMYLIGRIVSKLLICSACYFASLTSAVDANNLLVAEDAFNFNARLKNPDTLQLTWHISDRCYLYQHKFKLASLTPGVKLGNPLFPEGETKQDVLFGEVEVYRHHLALEVPVERANPQLSKFDFEVFFQGCSEEGVCYMPSRQTVSIDLSNKNIIQNSATPTNESKPFVSEQSRIAALLENQSAWLVILSFLGFGILLAFTPCVFPMLPILSGIVIGHSSKITTARAFCLSLSYVLASAITYTIFGVLAGLFGSNLQTLFQEPWIISAFSGLFFVLALSMFGVFQLQIPAAIQTRLMVFSSNQQGGNLWGAGLMGMFSALAIGPCVTAPLTGALIYIGQTGDAVLGGLALFALGLGMGLPLLVIGTYAGHWLPKAGAWMNVTKTIFGIGLLGVAIWLLGRILPPLATLSLWLLLAIVPILLTWKKQWQYAGILTAIYSAILWIGISTNQPQALRPLLCTAAVACQEQLALTLQFKQIATIQELQHTLANAEANNQRVMLDFYADWCASCQELALYTFADSQVREALSNTVLLQADVTKNSEADQDLLKHFNLIGPPAILFFGPDQKEQSAYRVVGFVKADKFLDIINQVFEESALVGVSQ
jgi:thioredoxin:protein disulfide reductase